MSKLEYNSAGELELDGVRLSTLVKDDDEPAYVYSRKGLLDRLFLFQSAIAKVLTQRFSIHYAMKANSHPEVLKLFKAQNIGVDMSADFPQIKLFSQVWRKPVTKFSSV